MTQDLRYALWRMAFWKAHGHMTTGQIDQGVKAGTIQPYIMPDGSEWQPGRVTA